MTHSWPIGCDAGSTGELPGAAFFPIKETDLLLLYLPGLCGILGTEAAILQSQV